MKQQHGTSKSQYNLCPTVRFFSHGSHTLHAKGGLELEEKRAQPGIVDPKEPTILMAVIAIFTPFGMSIATTHYSILIVTSTLMIDFQNGPTHLSFGLEFIELMAPFTILRFVFVLQMFRYYRGNSTRKRTLIVGAIAEPLLWISIPYFLLNPSNTEISVPLPFLLIAGVLLLWKYPSCIDKDDKNALW